MADNIFNETISSITNATGAGSGQQTSSPGGNMIFASGAMVERRELTLAVMPHISGFMSLMGSSYVAYEILRKIRTKGAQSYHYIILLMSLADIVSSFCFAMGTWPMPPGPNGKFRRPSRLWASGNDQTCTAQGFGIQLGIMVIFLNVMLSCHYLAVIRWRVREEQIRKYLLPGLVFCLVIGLSLSVPFLFLKAYNFNPVWCWLGPNFSECAQEGLDMAACVDRTNRWRNWAYFGPLWLCVGITTLLQLAILWTVVSTDKKADRWRFQSITSKAAYRSSIQKRNMKKQQKRAKKMMQSSRVVARQSFLYLSTFYVCWIPFTVASNILKNRSDILNGNEFWLVLLTTIVQPLQGFFNCLIYHHRAIGKWIEPKMNGLKKLITPFWTAVTRRCTFSCCSGESSEETDERDTKNNNNNNSNSKPPKDIEMPPAARTQISSDMPESAYEKNHPDVVEYNDVVDPPQQRRGSHDTSASGDTFDSGDELPTDLYQP